MREQLNAIVEAAAAEAARLDRREEDLARAIELTTTDAAVQSAWHQCRYEQRRWFQRLITMQLKNASLTRSARAALRDLSRLVEQGDG
jgi:hypothetical protein